MDHVRHTFVDRVHAEPRPPRLVLLDLSATPYVDMHSAHMLGEVAEELTKAGVRVQAVEARSSVRDRLRNEGVDEKLGGIDRFTTVADAVEAAQGDTPWRLDATPEDKAPLDPPLKTLQHCRGPLSLCRAPWRGTPASCEVPVAVRRLAPVRGADRGNSREADSAKTAARFQVGDAAGAAPVE